MRSPAFLFLLPVFFVFHGFVENYRFISFLDCLSLMAIYSVAALVLYLLAWLIFKNTIKPALLAAFILSFYFFFGTFHDFLRMHAIFLHRYIFLLPFFAVVTVLLILFLRKRNTFSRLPLFLNSLLLIYLLIDGVSLALGATGRALLKPSSYSLPKGTYKTCDTCSKPDIYFLLFDEYSSSRALKEAYHYDNSGLDSFLINEGFQIQKASRSNYPITPFSMASMLNLSYLKNIADPQNIKPDDYTNIFEPIRTNEVVRFLLSNGYAIVNNSPFDLPGHPASVDQPFIPAKLKLITNRTLLNYIVRDMGPWLEGHFTNPIILAESRAAQTYHLNQQLFAQTIAESGGRASGPRFVYTHLLMPHFPFEFDSLQHRRRPEEVARETNDDPGPRPYLNYLPYTNSRIKELITAIQKNAGGKAVIIFMSDHGFRHSLKDLPDDRLFFANQNAIYFPDRDYSLFYDSISAVNEFRVVFNKLFGQKIPLLKDSTILLRDNRK